MGIPREPDALLIGGPWDDTPFTAEDAAIVELEMDGLVHRYVATNRLRDHDGQSVAVYAYDGAARPPGEKPR